jgi:hypothetical protein
MRKPRWRLLTWALIIWTAGILVWSIIGVSSRGCQDEDGDIKQTWCEVGTGVGISVIFVIGFMGFVVLSLVWPMTHASRRACPACGNDVKSGVTVCRSCGHALASSDADPIRGSRGGR